MEMLLRMALTLTAQPADAEDLTQDTLVRAYRAVDRFDGRHPRAWLVTIMRHAEVNRRQRRRPYLLDDPETDLERLVATDGPATPEEIVLGRTFDTVVDAALATLPDKFRQVVRLVDMGGLSYAQAAELLRIPEGTVMSRLHRARKRIRTQLAKTEHVDRPGDLGG